MLTIIKPNLSKIVLKFVINLARTLLIKKT
jgi:hypothetical protein